MLLLRTDTAEQNIEIKKKYCILYYINLINIYHHILISKASFIKKTQIFPKDQVAFQFILEHYLPICTSQNTISFISQILS